MSSQRLIMLSERLIVRRGVALATAVVASAAAIGCSGDSESGGAAAADLRCPKMPFVGSVRSGPHVGGELAGKLSVARKPSGELVGALERPGGRPPVPTAGTLDGRELTLRFRFANFEVSGTGSADGPIRRCADLPADGGLRVAATDDPEAASTADRGDWELAGPLGGDSAGDDGTTSEGDSGLQTSGYESLYEGNIPPKGKLKKVGRGRERAQ
jgi:hypothetical protein